MKQREAPLTKLVFFLAVLAFADVRCAFGSRVLFTDRHDYGCVSTAAADVNGDGIPDMICNANGVQVLLGNGDGTFRDGPLSDVSFLPIEIKAADLNDDGKIDLILLGVANGVNCCVAISYGNGDGTFQTATSYNVGSDHEMTSLILGDFNGDGILDIGTLGESGFWLFTGSGGGLLNPAVLSPISNSGTSLAAADVNHDGKLDVVANGDSGFTVLLGNGNSTFQPPIVTPSRFPNLGSSSLAVADLNGDGYVDVVLVNSAYTYVLTYFGKGDGSFTTPKLVSLPGNTDVAIADVNGDGIPDLISDGVYIALGRGNGSFRSPVYYAIASSALGGGQRVFTADLLLKGQPDILIFAPSVGTSVLLNEGTGYFEDGTWSPVTGGSAYCPAFADFNGDGKLDMAVGTDTGVSLLLGTGKASAPFEQGAFLPVGTYYCMAGGDLNNDGIPDLLVVAAKTFPDGIILSYLGEGDGTFTLKNASPVTRYGIPVLADFNGDGILDYALSGNLFALGNGDGTFQTPQQISADPPELGFDSIAVGDLNEDGKPDLVLNDLYNSVNYVMLNSGGSSFRESYVYTEQACYDAQYPVIADVNGDGHLDLVFGCGLGGAAIFLNNGRGTFKYAKIITDSIDSNGSSPIVADVNGDGIPDILALESLDFAVFLGEGGLKYSSPFSYFGTGAAPTGIHVANLHGQSPQAGTPDIVVPDGSGAILTIINRTK